MSFVILPVDQSDIEAAAEIHHLSFGSTTPLHILMYPNGFTSDAKTNMMQVYQNGLDHSSTTCLKVVDTKNNRMAAWGDWKVVTTSGHIQTKDLRTSEAPKKSTIVSPDIDTDFISKFSAIHRRLREEHLESKAHIHLNISVTHPEYQRQGCGKLLLQSCIEAAKALQLPIILEASPVGLPLYLRSGFLPVPNAVAEMDLNQYGHDYVDRAIMMEYSVPGE